MTIEEILGLPENKTLEFKENTHALLGIIKTVVAFANTAGGTIVLGVNDKTKKVVGIQNALLEEERLTSTIADSVAPFIAPDIEIQTYRDHEIILIHIPHLVGPYYVKTYGPEKGVYVRFGSTNRVVDTAMLATLKLAAQNKSFDELPYMQEKTKLDGEAISKAFQKVNKTVTPEKSLLLGLVAKQGSHEYPSHGGIILFGQDRLRIFPDAIIRCARFLGDTKAQIHDYADITSYPVIALEEALRFIERNTSMKAEIGRLYRTDIPEYPPIAIREAVTNAIVHTDYALRGATITIAIFDNRMEITNPGGLVFGMTLSKALAGSSVVRNHVIAHTFRELGLIERWGSGLQRIISACAARGLETPTFEELGNEFKVTLYSTQAQDIVLDQSQKEFLAFLNEKEKISTKDAAQFWNIAPRNALERLKQLVELGFIKKVGTSAQDPHGRYILKK